jgi:3-phenylpropionate/trans-cinnamate dioxygenase ferredoxin subunit
VNDVGEYVKIAETSDVSKNQMKVFNVKGQEILLINVEGKFYAFDNRCPHMGYPLFFGSLKGDTVTCGFHSAKFNVRTGESVGPVTSERLKTFPVKIQNSSIFIEV